MRIDNFLSGFMMPGINQTRHIPQMDPWGGPVYTANQTTPHQPANQAASLPGFDPVNLIFMLFSLLGSNLFQVLNPNNSNNGDNDNDNGNNNNNNNGNSNSPARIAANETASIAYVDVKIVITGGDGGSYELSLPNETLDNANQKLLYNSKYYRAEVVSLLKDGSSGEDDAFEVQAIFDRNHKIYYIQPYPGEPITMEGTGHTTEEGNEVAPQQGDGSTESGEAESSASLTVAEGELTILPEPDRGPKLLRGVTVSAGRESLIINTDGVHLADKDNNATVSKTLDVGETYTTENGTKITRTEEGYTVESANGRYTMDLTSATGEGIEGDYFDVAIKTSDEGVGKDAAKTPTGMLGETFDADDDAQTGLKKNYNSYRELNREFDDMDTQAFMKALVELGIDTNKDGFSSRELRKASKLFAQQGNENYSNAAHRLAQAYDGWHLGHVVHSPGLLFGGFSYFRSPAVDVNNDYRLNYTVDQDGNVKHSELYFTDDTNGEPDTLSTSEIENFNAQMTPEHWQTIRNAALNMDTDGDGAVDMTELEKGLRKLGESGQSNLYLHFKAARQDVHTPYPIYGTTSLDSSSGQLVESLEGNATSDLGSSGSTSSGAELSVAYPIWWRAYSVLDPDRDGKIQLGTEQDNVFKDLAAQSQFGDNYIDEQDYQRHPFYYVINDTFVEGDTANTQPSQ